MFDNSIFERFANVSPTRVHVCVSQCVLIKVTNAPVKKLGRISARWGNQINLVRNSF